MEEHLEIPSTVLSPPINSIASEDPVRPRKILPDEMATFLHKYRLVEVSTAKYPFRLDTNSTMVSEGANCSAGTAGLRLFNWIAKKLIPPFGL